jgi:hypothetical protein
LLCIAIFSNAFGSALQGTSSSLFPGINGEAAPQFDQAIRATLVDLSQCCSAILWETSGSAAARRLCGAWTADGLSRWRSQDGLPDDDSEALFIDDEQNLWIGMLTGGLSRWRKGALAPYGDPEGFHTAYSANVLTDSHGDLWLGTWDKGLFRRHNGQLIPTSPPTMPIAIPIRARRRSQRTDMGRYLV